ncbi:MAG: ROK family protein, partial [Pseudonocardiaceae bacterium]
MSRLAAVRGGIDLGGTKIQTAVVGDGEVVAEARRPTPTKGGPEDVAREMVEAMREAAQGAKLETSALEGIGVGSPG